MSLIMLFMAAISYGLSVLCLTIPGHPPLAQFAAFFNAAVGGWNLRNLTIAWTEDDEEETN